MHPTVSHRTRVCLLAAVSAVVLPLLATPAYGGAPAATQAAGIQHVDSPASAGFQTRHTFVTNITVGFTVPELDCTTTPSSGASIVVSFDRLDGGSPNRIMVHLDCVKGSPVYSAWWKEAGRAPENCYENPTPGKADAATVWEDGRIVLESNDCGEVFTNVPSDGVHLASIRVRAQPGPHGELKPLTDFGTIYFWQASVNKSSMTMIPRTEWRMVDAAGTVLAVCSGMHADGSFAINWRAAS